MRVPNPDPHATRTQRAVPAAAPLDDLAADHRPAQDLLPEKLALAKQAANAGDRHLGYRYAQEAVQIAPDDVQAWVYSAALAPTDQDRLAALGKVMSLAPHNTRAGRDLYQTLKGYMERDPFLKYLEETDDLYRVLTGNGYLVTVPKDRAITKPYPPPKPTPLDPAFRWLRYALIGLPLAGLLTILCAPIAMLHVWRARAEIRGMYQRRAQMIAVYAGILWAMGIALAALFLLHL